MFTAARPGSMIVVEETLNISSEGSSLTPSQLVGSSESAAPTFPYLSADEKHLVLRARAGDQRALRTFYDQYQGQVRRYLFRLLGPDSEIDDLLQTIFVRAFGALGNFEGRSAIRTWLYRITANTAHNQLRRRFRSDRTRRAFQWFNLSLGPAVGATKVEARDEAERILQRLHPDLREVFVLYNYEGLTLQEISTVIERPVSTVGDRLTRSRKKLRELLEAES